MSAMFGSLSNFGFVRDQLPPALLVSLKDEIRQLDKDANENKFNKNLAGNIKQEFKLGKHSQELEKYLITLCEDYVSAWDTTRTARDLRADNLELYSYWANIQRKNEFNPMHSHDGLYSFAIWLEVPYLMAEEIEASPGRDSNSPRAGMFSFIYTNIFGEIREAEFPIDKTYEGTVFLFPSCLQHLVYPFSSSDGTRISISGNLRRKL